uniref:SMP-30/Gluconolactonase/LRE-like region domain-containing protein n=1 Tax=Branchiostoma floridae TaxID=7739 RepID=C3Z038_BRAFL|eukprot:XP_002598085.1 hypothetical protein BRAFLDRAFT_85698 [Branchiostoma floridae]
MSEDVPSGATPKVVRKDVLSESITKQVAETVPPLARQDDEGVDLHIPDHKQPCTKSDDAAVAHISKDGSTEETLVDTKMEPFQVTKIAPDGSHKGDTRLSGRDSLKNGSYTSTFTGNLRKNQNPMYTHRPTNPSPTYALDEVNPNPLYLQSTTEANASSGQASKSNNNDSYSCSQPSADTHQQDGDVTSKANNSENPSLWSYVVTQKQHGNKEIVVEDANNEDSSCIQAFAYGWQEHNETVAELASCDVVKRCAVRNQEDVVESANANNNPRIQPYVVKYQKGNGADAGPADIQPYAVKYQERNDDPLPAAENGQTASIASDDADIKPYAVKYDEHDVTAQNGQTASIPSDDADIQPYAVKCEEHEDGNNDYKPPRTKLNVVSDDAEVDIQPYAVAYMDRDDIACSTTSSGSTQTKDTFQARTAASNSNVDVASSSPSINRAHVSGSVNDGQDNNEVQHALHPNPMYVPNVQRQEAFENHDRYEMKTSFGGRGEDPGQFGEISGVAVSADNEIFVSDFQTKRIQVFDMNGLYLRSFTMVLPSDTDCKVNPTDIAVDGKANVWAVDPSLFATSCPHVVVQYSRDGRPMSKFKVGFRRSNVPSAHIAVDVRNDKIIVGEKDEIMIFEPNGSLVRRFVEANLRMGGVTSTMLGNILVTDSFSKVMVYNHSGVRLYTFGIWGTRQGNLWNPLGICVDSLGRILVANSANNRVDMFTSGGEFVLTVASIDDPWRIAMGPDGQLVVTNVKNSYVTILLRHSALP